MTSWLKNQGTPLFGQDLLEFCTSWEIGNWLGWFDPKTFWLPCWQWICQYNFIHLKCFQNDLTLSFRSLKKKGSKGPLWKRILSCADGLIFFHCFKKKCLIQIAFLAPWQWVFMSVRKRERKWMKHTLLMTQVLLMSWFWSKTPEV